MPSAVSSVGNHATFVAVNMFFVWCNVDGLSYPIRINPPAAFYLNWSARKSCRHREIMDASCQDRNKYIVRNSSMDGWILDARIVCCYNMYVCVYWSRSWKEE